LNSLIKFSKRRKGLQKVIDLPGRLGDTKPTDFVLEVVSKHGSPGFNIEMGAGVKHSFQKPLSLQKKYLTFFHYTPVFNKWNILNRLFTKTG